MEAIITHRDIIYQIIKNPINIDPNYNKSMYHIYMGSKLMAYVEMLMFTYDVPVFTKHLNELFEFLIQYSTVIEEFPTFMPVIVTAVKYIRTNPILFSEQTDGFQATRRLLETSRILRIAYE